MPKPKRSSKELEPLTVRRKPSSEARYRLRECARQLLKEDYGYRESQELLRLYLLDTALMSAGGVKKKAAAQLGISRDHVRDYHARGKEFI